MLATRIATLLKSYGWVLNLLFIALGAYFVAGAVNAVVARKVRTIPTVEDMQNNRGRRASNKQTRAPTALTAIASRNLFGAKREDLEALEEQEKQAKQEQEQEAITGRDYDPAELEPCSLPISVRGTLVAEGAPEWSMALIYVNNERETKVFTINEGANEIDDDAALVDILDRQIVVRRRDHFERCLAEGEEKERPRRRTRKRRRSRRRDDDSGGGGRGVKRVSSNEYKIDSSERDRVMNNLSKVATQARIVPSFKNGKPNGFKLFSIKPRSIFSKIGLQNGDVIQKINGYEINSPDKALELYQKLKDTRSISVELLRRGRQKSFQYEID
mgnify:CR=1 FL=1